MVLLALGYPMNAINLGETRGVNNDMTGSGREEQSRMLDN